MKTCTKCGEEKAASEFQFRKDIGGYRGQCRKCTNEYKRKWHYTDKGKILRKKWNNSDKKRAHARKYCKTEKGKISQRKEQSKPMSIIRSKYRTLLNRFLIKGYDTQKSRDIIGCTRDDLRARFKLMFEEGMTWNNYGEWQIDHMILIDARSRPPH